MMKTKPLVAILVILGLFLIWLFILPIPSLVSERVAEELVPWAKCYSDDDCILNKSVTRCCVNKNFTMFVEKYAEQNMTFWALGKCPDIYLDATCRCGLFKNATFGGCYIYKPRPPCVGIDCVRVEVRTTMGIK